MITQKSTHCSAQTAGRHSSRSLIITPSNVCKACGKHRQPSRQTAKL